jgi:DtxR family Mn-dependent transcriptional regulator
MAQIGEISESLEDYLKIIFQLERERRVARVKDIAAHKGVRMASVTGALRRMSKEGLVHYGAREFVELTDQGKELARKVVQRHDFLKRFLVKTLGIPEDVAERDADAVEHHLSSGTIVRLAAFFQFMESYGHGDSLTRFLKDGSTIPCENVLDTREASAPPPRSSGTSLSDESTWGLVQVDKLEPGSWGRILWLDGDEQHRLSLIEKGILPRVRVEMESIHQGTVRVRIKGIPVVLSADEARLIRVRPMPEGPGEF